MVQTINSAPAERTPSMTVVVVEHPLVADRVAVLREHSTDRRMFRAALADLARMLMYEASRDFSTAERTIQTPLAPAQAHVIELDPCLVPITRSGLGMLGPALELFPRAGVAFIGLKRDETTFQPIPYL